MVEKFSPSKSELLRARKINRETNAKGLFDNNEHTTRSSRLKEINQDTAQELRKLAKEGNKLFLSRQEVYQNKEKLRDKKRNKFSHAVESQNVQGIIPPTENRGIHNMVVFNPFGVPEKEVDRDSRTGLLHVRNSIWG